MILIATTAVCATVIFRANERVNAAQLENRSVSSEIGSLQQANQSLRLEIGRLATDSTAIEVAARERLGMVRATDVVVPIEVLNGSANLGTLSFVH
jgi:cell division protein FtsL